MRPDLKEPGDTELDPSQAHYDATFNKITSSPENQSFGEQAEAGLNDGFKYTSDPDRARLQNSELSGGSNAEDPGNEMNYVASRTGIDPLAADKGAVKPETTRARIRGFMTKKATIGVLGGGVGTVLFIIFISLSSATLGLVHAKKNAEETLGGITSHVIGKRQSRLMSVSQRAGFKSLFKSLNLASNMDVVSRKMARKGYTLTPEGIKTPDTRLRPSRTIPFDDTAEFDKVIRKEARTTVKGYRQRNKVAKNLRKSLALQIKASVDVANIDKDKTSTESMREEARKGAFDGDGNKPGIDQVEDALDELKASVDDAEAVERRADDLAADGAAEAPLDADSVARALASSGDEILEEGVGQIGENIAKRSVSGEALSLAKGGVNEVTQLTCRAGKAASAAYVAGLVAKKYSLIKIFSVFANNADAIVLGRADAQMVGDFMNLIQSGKSGSSWTQSGGMQYIFGNKDPGSRIVSRKTKQYFRTDRQETSGFIRGLISLSKKEVGGVNVCSVAGNPATQIVIAAGEWGTTIFVGAATGGAGAAATVGAGAAAKSSISVALAKAVGIGIAVEVGSAIGEAWMKSYVSSMFTSTLMTFSHGEGGPFAGDGFAASAGAFYETSGRTSGMGPINSVTYSRLMKDVRNDQRTEYAKKSLFDRFISIDPKSSDSLLASAIARSPVVNTNPVLTAQNITKSTLSGAPFATASKLASGTLYADAYAQAQDVDENGNVVDPYGNLIVGADIDSIDPETNFNQLASENQIDANGEPISGSALDSYIKNCAQVVDIHVKDTGNSLLPECTGTTASTTTSRSSIRKYQAYLADYDAAAAFDAEVNPIEGTGGGSNPGSGSGGTTPTAPVQESETALTKNGGGIRVHKSIVSQVEQMIDAAAAGGVTLTGSGWRDNAQQIQLRKDHCGTSQYAIYEMSPNQCSPPTARPGKSQHELGLAIDFSNCSSRSTACYRWLSVNAATFGFKNLESEPWHWSTTGS